MPAANDVATYIKEQLVQASDYKLQKLMYYAQAWSLAWTGAPLFPEAIEAWKDGPVVPSVRLLQKDNVRGDASTLTPDDRATVDAVLSFYARFEAEELSGLSHRERPWRAAREGLSANDRSNEEITTASLQEFYGPQAGSRTSEQGVRRIPESVMLGAHFLLSVPESEIDDVGEVDESVRVEDVIPWLQSGEGDPWPASSP